MNHQSSFHYDNDLNSKLDQVRGNIHAFGRGMNCLSMLYTESELRRCNTDGTSLLNVPFRNRNDTDIALKKLQISGDLIPLSTYSCASVITREEKQQNSFKKKQARKFERLAARKAERQAAIQGVTPLSKARDDVIRKVNDLLGRGREQTTVTYVAHFTLERIASYVFVGELRNTSSQLYYANTSDALMPYEALMYAYNKNIRDSFTRARVHLDLMSCGRISMVPCPGRPHAIRVKEIDFPCVCRPINSEDVEMFWIQMEKNYVLTEMIERGTISRRGLAHEITFDSKERFNDPTERGKVNKLTNVELEERLDEISTRLKLAERKPYAARQKQVDSDVIEEMFSNNYRCDIDPKILRTIFSSDSPYAQQLINIYTLLHSAFDYNFNWNPQKLQNIADLSPDGQSTDRTGLNDIKYTYAAVNTLLRFRRIYCLTSLVVPDDYLANWNHYVPLGSDLHNSGAFNLSVAIHDLALTLSTSLPTVETPDLSHLALASPGLKDLSSALAALKSKRRICLYKPGVKFIDLRPTIPNELDLDLAKIALVTYVLANVALAKPGLTFKPLINLARSNPDLAKFSLANPELAHDSVAGFIERSPSLGDVCLAIHTIANLILPDRQLVNQDQDDDDSDVTSKVGMNQTIQCPSKPGLTNQD